MAVWKFCLMPLRNTIIRMKNWRDRFIQRYEELKAKEGLTQEVLAERIGVSQSTIAHWKSGRRNPESLEDYEKLAYGLKVHPVWLLYGIDPELVVDTKEAARHARDWESLPPSERAALFQVVHAMAEQQHSAKGEAADPFEEPILPPYSNVTGF